MASQIMSPRRQRMLERCDKTAGCTDPDDCPHSFDLPAIPPFLPDQMSRNDQEDAFFASPSHVSKTDCCLNLRGKTEQMILRNRRQRAFCFKATPALTCRCQASRGNTFDMLDVTKCQWAVGHRYHRENL